MSSDKYKLLSSIQTSAHRCVYFYQQNSAFPGLTDFFFFFLTLLLSHLYTTFPGCPPSFPALSNTQPSPVVGLGYDWHLRTLQGITWVGGGRESSGESSGLFCTSLSFTKSAHWLSGPLWGGAGAGFRKTEARRPLCGSPHKWKQILFHLDRVLGEYFIRSLKKRDITKPRKDSKEKCLWDSETAHKSLHEDIWLC